MYYIEELKLYLKNGKTSSVKFGKGLNIIYGESNTGKSMIYNCLDYMMGGTSTDRINERLGITHISLTVIADEKTITMSREMNVNVFTVSSDHEEIESGEYRTGGNGNGNKISDLWFKLMKIEKPDKVLKNLSGETQGMSIRTIYHLFMIDEGRIPIHRSILIPTISQNAKMHAPTISSLVYLATGESHAPKVEGMTDRVIGIKNNALQSFVDANLLDLEEYQDETGGGEAEGLSPVQIQKRIDDILGEIASLEDNLSNATSKRKEVSDRILELEDVASENKVLNNRYNALQTQYAADIRRLTFLIEGSMAEDNIEMPTQCPFCNGTLPKEKEESCVEAAANEVKKIEAQIEDLSSVQDVLSEDIIKNAAEIEILEREKAKYDEIIRGEITPQIEKLRDCLGEYTQALSQSKANEMIKGFRNILSRQLGVAVNEDENLHIDIRKKFLEVYEDKINDRVKDMLETCNYDHYTSSEFDESALDITVNRSLKSSQGEGFRAYLNTVLALTVQNIIDESKLCHIGFMCIDSPVLSLKEKNDEAEPSETMKAGLFKYFVDHSDDRQMIIIENTIPDIDYKGAKIHRFTKDESEGRYGLVEDYRD